jgi:acyl-CoA thioester hydrolase
MLTYQDEVRAEWVDDNGHMRDAYYLLLFSLASDALMDHIGLDHPRTLPPPAANSDPQQRRGHSLFTLQYNLHYLHEVRLGARVLVRTRILAHDAKRLHLYASLLLAGEEREMAAAESMQLHVEMAGPRAAPFLPAPLAKVQALAAMDAAQPWPALAGKLIGLPQR